MNELTKSIHDISALFEALAIRYAIMGGIAVRVYGIPRATYDIDFTAAIDRPALGELFRLVHDLGYTVADSFLRGWVDQVGGMPLVKFRLFLEGRGVDVDVFLAETGFQTSLLNRRRWAKLNGNEAWVVSPEDLVLLKLVAGSPRDIADVGDVLFMQGELDLSYMRSWAAQIGISDRLETIIRVEADNHSRAAVRPCESADTIT